MFAADSETVGPYSGPELRNRQVVFRAETLSQLQRSLLLHDKPCDDADHKSNQENGNNDGVGGDHGHEILPAVGLYCARHRIFTSTLSGDARGASDGVLSKIRQDAASYFPTLT